MSEFTVNPETCPRCETERDTKVELRAGTCPECGYEADGT